LAECMDAADATLSSEALQAIDRIHHFHMNPCP
jgi:aryl-alcohol dehydrogenase-like predicted oxidoreductase